MRFADPPDVPHIPNVDTVVVVDTGELVVALVERQRDRVRIPRLEWVLGHVTEKNGRERRGRRVIDAAA